MNVFQYVCSLPGRLIRRIKRDRFYRQYPNIERGCYIGQDGIGKNCVLDGGNRLHIGTDTFIGEGSELFAYASHFDRQLDSQLTLGTHVRITARCRITCAGNITIGKDCLFAPDVFITDHNHGMNPEFPGGYSPQDIQIQEVTIGEGVWLGQRVCVLPGVTIGEHSIIGAGSVVTKSIPAYSMAVGTPAKVIKIWDFHEKSWKKV